MSFFYGKYFDGKSAKENEIQIYLEQESITFYLLNNSNLLEPKIWKLETIKVESFNLKKAILLSYGDFPKQTIQIYGEENIKLILEKYPTLFKNNFFKQIFGKNSLAILIASIVTIILFFVFFYQIILPFLTQKIINQIPIKSEVFMGDKMANNLLEDIKTNPKAISFAKSKLLNSFFKKAGFKSNYPIKIYFINENIVNAFAIPGGTILIYDGIVKKIKSGDELAALLAHELAHIEKRHSLITITKGLSNYLILSLITSDISGVAAVLIDNAMMLKNLSNSREFEKEADLVGLSYLIDNNLPPTGLIYLLKNIEQNNNTKEDTFKDLSYLSSHPSSTERINYIQAKINQRQLNKTSFAKRKELEELFNQLKK